MIPVDQDRFGKPHGNCHAACVASILEVPLWRVPSVSNLDDWVPRLALWLRRHGLGHFFFTTEHANDPAWKRLLGYHYLIAGGPAARGVLHSVVYRGLTELAHDPHPDRSGLIRVDDYTLISVSDVATFRASILSGVAL